MGQDDLRQDSSFVGELARELDRIGENAFRQKYSHPFLVEVYRPKDDFEDDGDAQTGEVQSVDFSQEVSEWMIMKTIAVAKPDRGISESRVTVGRAKSNDIVLRGSKISKRHASFDKDKDQWRLMDMGSANGTAVNGNRLQKNQKAKIKSRDVISFWRYAFEFHEASSFIEFLLKVVLRRGLGPRKGDGEG